MGARDDASLWLLPTVLVCYCLPMSEADCHDYITSCWGQLAEARHFQDIFSFV